MNYIGLFNAQRSGYGDIVRRTMVFIGFSNVEQIKKYVTYTFLNIVRHEYPYERFSDLVLEAIEEYDPSIETSELNLYHLQPVLGTPSEKVGSYVVDRIGTVFNFGKKHHFIAWDRQSYQNLDKVYHVIDIFSDKSQLKDMRHMLVPNGPNPLTYLERICVTLGQDPTKLIRTALSNVKDNEIFDAVTESVSVMPKDHIPVVVFHDTAVSRIYASMMLINGHFNLPGKAFYEFEHPFKRSLGNVVMEIIIEPGHCSFSQLAISGYIFESDTAVIQGTDAE